MSMFESNFFLNNGNFVILTKALLQYTKWIIQNFIQIGPQIVGMPWQGSFRYQIHEFITDSSLAHAYIVSIYKRSDNKSINCSHLP